MDPDNPIFAVEAPEPNDSPLDLWCDEVLLRWRALPQHSLSLLLREARSAAEEILLSPRLMPDEVANRIIHVLAYIYDSTCPPLALDVVCYAFGLIGRSGQSMAAISMRHNISRQAFSSRLQEACVEFHLQPRGSMRSKEDKEKYTKVQKNRWQLLNQDAPV